MEKRRREEGEKKERRRGEEEKRRREEEKKRRREEEKKRRREEEKKRRIPGGEGSIANSSRERYVPFFLFAREDEVDGV